jgi:hypothetical protein|tara:strand:- start:800 stop:1066 length:267 start_codon:yes stop_codon:yes gene_type:complete
MKANYFKKPMAEQLATAIASMVICAIMGGYLLHFLVTGLASSSANPQATMMSLCAILMVSTMCGVSSWKLKKMLESVDKMEKRLEELE